ncbi:DUF6801 domain-containing protein [Streptomyces sp. NPDC057499]|uniref:DUF6801 domain-containing protein n=1 Tax=Streptomyces sp. NPDC057499 TaxID=3346150 RepID=UPI0036B75162
MRMKSIRSRRWGQAGAVGGMALLAGLMPGTGVASATHVVETPLGYTCTTASGEHGADVTVSVELPVSSPVGAEVQPEQVRIGVALAPELLGELPEGDSPVLSGAASLRTTVTQNGVSTDVMWQALEIPESAVDADGDTNVEASGAVPTVTPRSSGAMVFAAGKLQLDLVVRAAAGGEAAAPDVVPVTCTADADQSAELGTVQVPVSSEGTVPGTSGQGPDAGTSPKPDARSADAGVAADTGEVTPPDLPGCTILFGPVAAPPRPAHGYMAGYANVNKQKAATKFEDPAHLMLQLNSMLAVYSCPTGSLTWVHSEGTMDYRGKPQMPPARSTFLTFGFMPTTATVEMSLTGPVYIDTFNDGAPDPETGRRKESTTATTQVSLRLYDVSVNGTPLDVGPNCRTARSMELSLTGKGSTGSGPDEGYTVKSGGPLLGSADVPPFTGCGVTEDLDNMFTAAVSGPGNYTKMMQGPLCVDGAPANCPEPPRPKPQR